MRKASTKNVDLGSTRNFVVFTRPWWKPNASWPNGREPLANGRRNIIGYASTREEARAQCEKWNKENPEGKWGVRAEFDTN